MRKTYVKLSLAEKIKKTALNTGIRFNIVDNYGFDNASIQMFQDAQKQGMNADEQEFAEMVNTENAKRANKEILIESEEQLFVMRKPRFFNSVKQGYEWNKYNQTHFDSENPPPKVVQGYKFNIFFPELADKTKTPQFYLEPNGTNDTLTIRFGAGVPYEDIAFTIVSKEWEMSERHGFKRGFDRGIL